MNSLSTFHDEAIMPLSESATSRLGSFFKFATSAGWEIVSYDQVGIQLKRKKSYGATYYFVGALTAIFGIGLLIWIARWVDYAVSSDRLLYIPMQELMSSDGQEIANLLV